jgi:hypothetical protein
MFNSKAKGLYVDISEFSVLAARTSGFKLPISIEALAEYPLKSQEDFDGIRGFIESLVDFKGGGYFISRAGVYPDKSFVRYFEADSVHKAKDMAYLTEVLKSEFGLNPEVSQVAILDANDGADFDPKTSLSKQLVFCGAPTESLRVKQAELLKCGIYPERMELSTVTTLGGVSDYAKFNGLNSPMLCLEFTSSSANIFIINHGKVDVARAVPFGLDSIFPLLQKELGLKDEASARKLFFSNTFDFAEIGPKLLRRMTKELQASTGFYEVQTGLTIENVFISVLPKNLSWVAKTVADSLGLKILKPDLEKWLESLEIKVEDGVDLSNLGSRWMGLFSLMGEFQLRKEADSE